QSWANAGMGYAHRKDQLVLSGMMSVIGMAQALCPEPVGKIALAATRTAMAVGSLYNSGNSGVQRVYYKLTDELVPLGLPDSTSSLRNAPYPLTAAWNLPGNRRLKEMKRQFERALQAVDKLGGTASPEADAAFNRLQSVRNDYHKLRDAIDQYKATAYASQIEWAGYRQRAVTLGGGAALVAGTAVGIGLAGGPIGAAAGLALGVGVSLPLWAAAHLTYHFKGWKAPDNRDKLECCMRTLIKSPDLYDASTTSGLDIATRFTRYQEALVHARRCGLPLQPLHTAFSKEMTPLLNLELIETAWQKPMAIRIKLGKKILTGKFAMAIHEAQQLRARLIAGEGKDGDRAQLASRKREIKTLWSDLANVELFVGCGESLKKDMVKDTAKATDTARRAASALEKIADPDFRALMSGTLEKQMDAGEKAKRLTRGELVKYQLTYFVGSLLGDVTNIGLTLPALAQVSALPTASTGDGQAAAAPNATAYRMGAVASLIASANAAEVSAGRARFEQDNEQIYRHMKPKMAPFPSSPRPAPGLIKVSGKDFYESGDVPDAAVNRLVRNDAVPETVGLYRTSATACKTAPQIRVDLTTTEPFWQARRARLGWTSRLQPARAAVWVGVKYLGLSVAGLVHRIGASAISLPASRATRRELDALDDAASVLLATRRAAKPHAVSRTARTR
ncbi:MAG: hypothetical protein H7315_13135, partial [Herminiimonas sp.]|nr:hypothetical protein [Herminiimonas sp.]